MLHIGEASRIDKFNVKSDAIRGMTPSLEEKVLDILEEPEGYVNEDSHSSEELAIPLTRRENSAL